MSQARDIAFHPSSPLSSSEGADSFQATPDTRLTVFSPEDGAAKSSNFQDASSTGTETRPTTFAIGNFRDSARLQDRDPFAAGAQACKSQHQKLSPTASAFRPFTAFLSNGGIFPDSDSRTANDHYSQAISSTLSPDLGLSRCVLFSSASKGSGPISLDSYLAVSVDACFA